MLREELADTVRIGGIELRIVQNIEVFRYGRATPARGRRSGALVQSPPTVPQQWVVANQPATSNPEPSHQHGADARHPIVRHSPAENATIGVPHTTQFRVCIQPSSPVAS